MATSRGDSAREQAGEVGKANSSQRHHSNAARFAGTDNPRHLRVIHAQMVRSRTREDIDAIAGCSNGPELIAELRRRGLEIPCDRIPVIDRDGFEVKRGVYHLTAADRRKIHDWLRRRQNGFIQPWLAGLLAVSLPALVAAVSLLVGVLR